MRTAIIRYAKGFVVSDAAAADFVGCFEERKSSTGSRDTPCRGNAGRAPADNNHIDIAGARNLGRRRSARRSPGRLRYGSSRGNEGSTSQAHHEH